MTTQSTPKTYTAEQIIRVLSSRNFTVWYNGPFESFLCGDEDCPSKEEILESFSDLPGM